MLYPQLVALKSQPEPGFIGAIASRMLSTRASRGTVELARDELEELGRVFLILTFSNVN